MLQLQDGTDVNVRYLENAVKLNPNLIEFATELHQKNLIPVSTYVLDLDAHVQNATAMKAEAKKHNLTLYYMSKQIGRNPVVAQAVIYTGFQGVVTVEPQETRNLARYGIRIGHVGHLVNVPEHEIDYVLREVEPEVITVFNVEKAKMISDRATKLGRKQNLLLRPMSRHDINFPYMEGGIPEEDAVHSIEKIHSFPGVRVIGLTSFPCLLYDLELQRPVYTPNIDTIGRVAQEARGHGIEISQINTPPFCIAKTMKMYAEKGSTHLEPGMGISGVSPWQCFAPELHSDNIPGIVYVTEVSHFVDDFALVYGGGFEYIEIYEVKYGENDVVPDKSKFTLKALVGRTPQQLIKNQVDADFYDGVIDYHAKLYRKANMNVGDTVVYGLRPQIFVTRAQTAVVSGLRDNNPRLIGIFDHANNLIDRHGHLQGEPKTIELINRYAPA